MDGRGEDSNNLCQLSSSTTGEQTPTPNPRVYMDLSLDKCPPKRIVIELFADFMPKTAENFRALCTGEMGIGKTTGKPLHYKGTVFHRIYQHFAAEGGDFSNHDGTGGESIFGGTFPGESNPRRHFSGPGVLMSSNDVYLNTTGSQFLLCFTNNIILDMCYGGASVFGQVTEGLDVISELRQRAVRAARLEITDCGAYPDDDVARADKPQSSSESEASLQKDREVNPDEWSQSPDLDSKRLKSSFWFEGNGVTWPELYQVDEELTKKLLLTAEADLQSSPDEIPKSDESNAEILELNVKELTKTHSPDLESKRVESRPFLEGNCVIFKESEASLQKDREVNPDEWSPSPDLDSKRVDEQSVMTVMNTIGDDIVPELHEPIPGSPDEVLQSDDSNTKIYEELKRVTEELVSKFHVTSKYRRGGRNCFLRHQFKRSGPISKFENNILSESDKGEIEKLLRYQQQLIMRLDSTESNAEKKVAADKRRTDSKVDWWLVAASAGPMIWAGVSYICNQKFGAVYRE